MHRLWLWQCHVDLLLKPLRKTTQLTFSRRCGNQPSLTVDAACKAMSIPHRNTYMRSLCGGLQVSGRPRGRGRWVNLGTQLDVWGELPDGNAAAAALVLLVCLQRFLRQHQRGVVRHLLAKSAKVPGSHKIREQASSEQTSSVHQLTRRSELPFQPVMQLHDWVRCRLCFGMSSVLTHHVCWADSRNAKAILPSPVYDKQHDSSEVYACKEELTRPEKPSALPVWSLQPQHPPQSCAFSCPLHWAVSGEHSAINKCMSIASQQIASATKSYCVQSTEMSSENYKEGKQESVLRPGLQTAALSGCKGTGKMCSPGYLSCPRHCSSVPVHLSVCCLRGGLWHALSRLQFIAHTYLLMQYSNICGECSRHMYST